MPQNVYIHIPFCKSKCKYCSFVSYTLLELKEQYTDALQKEIKFYYNNEKLNTIYFGGGTPSLLSIDEFEKILSNFNFNSNTEITAELNPENIDLNYLEKLKNCGINRISLGCQTFNKNILKIIGRNHSSENVFRTIENAKKAGFENISLDFIYGLPTQTQDDFVNDLEQAITLDIQHISLYGLKIDEGSFFYGHYPKNLPDDDMQADMYLKAIEILNLNGFEHYEISNFSQKGFESQHNLNYWNNKSYYGFGTAAHGYKDSIRYSNNTSITDYINNPTVHASEHKVNNKEALEEEIFLGFRKIAGIDVSLIEKKFGINFREKYARQLKEYVFYKYLKETNKGFKLSKKGLLVSNNILSDFLE